MSKAPKRNPWDIDEDAIDNQEKQNKASVKGTICPFRNSSIGKTCHGCLYISNQVYSKDFPDKHPAKVWASEHRAKANMFFNIVFSDNPEVPVVINLKKEAGSHVLNKAKTEWKDILNPYKDKGRELVVKKVQESGRKYPSYDISPVLDKADWEVADEVWKEKACNLDQQNLISMLMGNEFTEDNFFDVSALKVGESKKFRILPPWQNGEDGESNRIFAQYIWRHWGLSEAQLNGKDDISWEGEVKDKDPEDDEDEKSPAPDEKKVEVESSKEDESGKEPECFGKEAYFDKDDEVCQECPHFKKCARTVAE